MQGTIVSYRRSMRDQTPSQVIVVVDGVTTRDEALKLVGKQTTWKSVHASIPGVVASTHGNSGALRVRFQRGLPGQAVTQKLTFA